ncbi:MAG TPA: amidase, partial [Acidimicrobiales bacterium]|nr:amidase [Acidimicrobiales bacterium]
PSPSTTELAFRSVTEARHLLARGETTSVELTETLLRRMEEADSDGPGVRAVLAICPDAIQTAQRMDEERRQGVVRGPLHGIPVLVKDNIDTPGSEGTTAGSLALAMTRPVKDAVVVQRLRASGAIVIGKSNLSEWANFRGKRSSSGWSATGGQCRNPHALERSPGGSSSGSGAGVAAGFAPVAVGTETDGSILCPAALNGIVGIKPTVGLTSRTGVVPISSSQDTVGPMARNVADAAALLGVLAGNAEGADPLDPYTMARPANLPADYAAFCDVGGLTGARIGVPREHYFGHSAKADVLVEAAFAVARDTGALIIDPAEVPTAKAISRSNDEFTVLLHEFRAGLEGYLATRPAGDGQPRTVSEIVAFNEAHASDELAFYGQEILIAACDVGGLDSPAYLKARARNRRKARQGGIDAALRGANADVLALPCMGPAWCIDHVNGDSHAGAGYQAAAVAGYPAISLPVGKVCGLPVGLLLVGTAWSEPTLIRIAFALEQALALGDDLRPAWRPQVE